MYVENASRAAGEGYLTVDNFEPNPKNPIIAAFFRNIGYADQLGSGVYNLFKYSSYYSGQEPEFLEGDIFKITVPLNDDYSFDFHLVGDEGKNTAKVLESADKEPISADKVQDSAGKVPVSADKVLEDVDKALISANMLLGSTDKILEVSPSAQQRLVLQYVEEKGKITSHQVESLLRVKQRRARAILGEMVEQGMLGRQGSYRSTVYVKK